MYRTKEETVKRYDHKNYVYIVMLHDEEEKKTPTTNQIKS